MVATHEQGGFGEPRAAQRAEHPERSFPAAAPEPTSRPSRPGKRESIPGPHYGPVRADSPIPFRRRTHSPRRSSPGERPARRGSAEKRLGDPDTGRPPDGGGSASGDRRTTAGHPVGGE